MNKLITFSLNKPENIIKIFIVKRFLYNNRLAWKEKFDNHYIKEIK